MFIGIEINQKMYIMDERNGSSDYFFYLREDEMTNNGIQEKAYAALKKTKGLGIAISIIIAILGILLFVKPIATTSVFIWIMVIGLLIMGIQKIVDYCRMPKGARDGFLLAGGILLVIITLILIGRGLNYEYAVTAGIEVCIAFMIAFTCIFTGIGRICGSGMVKASGGSQGLSIFSGILDIICGIIILGAPLLGLLTITVIFGIYLLITGIALLIRFISL